MTKSSAPILIIAHVFLTFLPAATDAQEKGAAVQGPRTTDEELFNALDLSLPGLEETRAAWQRGDAQGARRALADYFRNRRPPRWLFDPREIDRKIPCNLAAADKTVAGQICLGAVWHTFPDGKIDWFFNATANNPAVPMDNEWQWQLNRMYFWGELGRAYWATGDEKYAATFVEHLRSWARQCRRPDDSGNVYPSAWRTIEAGIRMGHIWFDAFNRLLLSPTLTDDDICLFIKLCYEHALHLSRHPTTGNWLTMEMNGLYTVGAALPEFKEAARWRGMAFASLHDELKRQFLPDGAQVELTPGYHQVALGNILALPKKAKALGLADEIPPDFVALTEKAFDFNLYLMTPDRDLPRFNDSWSVNVRASLAEAASLFPNREDFKWVATDGKQGRPPAASSWAFQYAGYYVMRSGWETDANYLCFDAGPLGYGHVHQDKLNVVVWAYGRNILFDSGGGSYERSKYRAYGTDTFSHNTVLVDGKPQRRGSRNRWENVSTVPLGVRFDSNEKRDYCVGKYDEGYGDSGNRPAVHVRRVLFIKPDVFLIADTLAPTDEKAHTYQARWHLLTTAGDFDEATGAFVTADEGAPNLAIVPLATEGLQARFASAQTEPELLGWHLERYTAQQYQPATTVTHTVKGAGWKYFVTLLLPLRPSARIRAADIAKVEQAGPGVFNVRFGDGRSMRIAVGLEPESEIEIVEAAADGTIVRKVNTADRD